MTDNAKAAEHYEREVTNEVVGELLIEAQDALAEAEGRVLELSAANDELQDENMNLRDALRNIKEATKSLGKAIMMERAATDSATRAYELKCLEFQAYADKQRQETS